MPPSQELRIPTEKITPFLDTMTRRLKKQGFSVADRCAIPQNNNHFYLPITEEAKQNKQVIPSIIATQYVLEDNGLICMSLEKQKILIISSQKMK